MDEPERLWNVICEGPSALEVDQHDLLPGPIVLVNRAIHLADRLEGHFIWAMEDDPNLLWRFAQGYWDDDVEVWGNNQSKHLWLGLGVPDDILTCRDWNLVYDDDLEAITVLPTVGATLARCMQKGPGRIRLFGADMHGTGGAFPKEDWDGEDGRWIEEETDAQALRWDREYKTYCHLRDEVAPSMGCIIERVGGVDRKPIEPDIDRALLRQSVKKAWFPGDREFDEATQALAEG